MKKKSKKAENILKELHIPYQYINSYYPDSSCVKEYCLYIEEADIEKIQKLNDIEKQIKRGSRMLSILPILSIGRIVLVVIVFCVLFGSCVHLESGL